MEDGVYKACSNDNKDHLNLQLALAVTFFMKNSRLLQLFTTTLYEFGRHGMVYV